MQNCCLQHTQFNGLISSASFPLCCSPSLSHHIFSSQPIFGCRTLRASNHIPTYQRAPPAPLPVSCTTSCLVLGRKKSIKKWPRCCWNALRIESTDEKNAFPDATPGSLFSHFTEASLSWTASRGDFCYRRPAECSISCGWQDLISVDGVNKAPKKRKTAHAVGGWICFSCGRGGRRRNTGTVMTVTSNDCNCVVFLPDSLCESSFYISLTWSGERGASAGDIRWPGGWDVPVQPHSQRMAVCRADVTCWDSTRENMVSYKYKIFISLLPCTSVTTFFSHTWTMVQK